MPPWTTNSTKIEHSTTKDNHFLPFCQLEGLKETVNGSCAVLHGGMLENGCSSWEKEEDGGSSWGEKRKKIRKKRRVTVT
jgi:hypothetical protein